ncbi:MAG: hypothetical protein ACP5QG_04570 [candidate division WOR-3 bacterium]
MRKLMFAPIAFMACAPKTTEKTPQANTDLTLTAGYQGGLVPVHLMFQPPHLIILKNGGVFVLTNEEGFCRYAGVRPEDRERIIGFANRLWESGLEGFFSVVGGAPDMPSLVINMSRENQVRQISIHGYPVGSLKERGGEFIDSLMAAASLATKTNENWVPWEIELRVMSWQLDTTGWRVYDWEGPDLPLDSLAEAFAMLELSGETASAVRDYLAGKTIYTRSEMALFRKNGKFYAIAILPVVR